jgi:7-keto-8-aminopelargonate synthetase-like enzyme
VYVSTLSEPLAPVEGGAEARKGEQLSTPRTLSADRLLRRFQHSAAHVRDAKLSRLLVEARARDGEEIVVDGAKLINFGSCSYLGLGADRRLIEAAKEAVEAFGTSYSSSIAYTAVGLYAEVRARLERMVGARVVLAPTTTLAHLSALPVLIRPGDLALVDAFAHSSVQLATQVLVSSGVEVELVPHSDIPSLELKLGEAFGRGVSRVWYIADGIYSMGGDQAPFGRLRALLDRFPDLWIYYDDAHGFSWAGRHGRGVAVESGGWHPRLVMAAGLSKSFGTLGGIVAMQDDDLAERVELCGAPLSFGGPIPPAMLGASVASADIHLSDEHDRLRAGIDARVALVRALAGDLEIPLVSRDRSPIAFVEIGGMETMMGIVARMKEAGYYVNGAMWPVVPQGHAGVRFTVTNGLGLDQIAAMMEELARHLRLVRRTSVKLDLSGDDPVIDLRDDAEDPHMVPLN